ncbi:hypothetical protein [Aureimonas jatrophae]|uniref:Glycosyltransferase, GT2 family n=1 Tax=Aureimonas jatrophae TaxID=1166073 RepID=A0A1H0F2B9_9HYPH|nr:hypothetical protein [Aureimonas jatrophae]MBB3950213.1 hypothetical protein [Aureimonas jatrophae]SDN88696.1 hypothetical protein SAMN05192530_102323 [Aureimonas jatrophae]
MNPISSAPSSIGSLVASRRRRRAGGAPDPELSLAGDLRLAVARTGEFLIEGHAADPLDPERRFVVELVLDGVASTIARADLFVPGLALAGADGPAVGDGCYGFVFALDGAQLPHVAVAEVRLANGAPLPGSPIRLHEGEPFVPADRPWGLARWRGGLEIEGWVSREAAPFPARVEARIDDETVAVARADRWRSVERGGDLQAEPGFRLRLPEEWADGRLHEVEIRVAGRPLPGAPLPILAAPDGLAAFFEGRAETDAERPRAERFDRWFPRSVPFAEFARWEARFPPAVPELPAQMRIAVAVIGEDGAEETLQAPDLLPRADWIGAVLPEREGRFEPGDLLHFLRDEGANCELLVVMRAGTLARPGGAERLLSALVTDPDAALAYGDAFLVLADGSEAPLALTAPDRERMLEQGAVGNALALRRAGAIQALEQGSATLDDLFLSPLEGASSRNTHRHVPGFGFALPLFGAGAADQLASAARRILAREDTAADVEPRADTTLPAVRIRRAVAMDATIVLDLGHGDAAVLERALDALEASRRVARVALSVSACALDEASARSLRLGGVAVECAPAGVSSARRLAGALMRAETEAVCLLDARLRPLDDAWLAELLGRLGDPGTGLVAPLITDREGFVLQAGLRLSLGRAPEPRGWGCGAQDPGPGDVLRVAHQVAAILPEAFATRRADFTALGGFDPVLFPCRFGAADYALKLQALGRRIVVSPDARFWREGAGVSPSPLERAAQMREAARLEARWAHAAACDPFCNPLVAGDGDALAWPPGDPAPRSGAMRPPRPVPPGW